MYNSLLIGSLVAIGFPGLAQAQCIVKQDSNQLVTTTCMTTASKWQGYSVITNIYKGSPYLTFPTWQKGSIQLEANSTPISCPVEFNIATNQVYCELQAGKPISVMPYRFTIENRTFIVYPIKVLGKKLPDYYELLHEGKINLLVQRKRVLMSAFKSRDIYQSQSNKYSGPNGEYNGSYEDKLKYYLQLPDSPPKAVELTSQSLLKALPGSSTFLRSRLSVNSLTVDKVIEALAFYDSNSATQ